MMDIIVKSWQHTAPRMDFSGLAAIVTGSTRGIGLGLAGVFAQPTRQFVTTEQLGALAAFVCTDAAASITGAALPVEGGWTAQ
jgi:NAD(P)-dependent dehydrogenase (short-subunit alcohol dehydrogenase family)